MPMPIRMRGILESVSKELEPTPFERRRAKMTFTQVKSRILRRASQLGLQVRVEEVGSVGKDTWIRGEADLDVFIVFPNGTRLREVESYGLKLGKYASKGKYVTAYAEHPYVRTRLNELQIDIVPCVGVRNPSRIMTAVDRTPFHKQFVIKRLNAKLRKGIRLLKRFMMTLGIYGADIKVQGFSGYLAELLAIHYGGFLETLREASNWLEGIIIDPIRAYDNQEDVRAVFGPDPIVVIDPVDRRRNVASAVTRAKMATFVAAADAFLEAPDRRYFTYHPQLPAAADLSRLIRRSSSELIGMRIDCPKLVPDVLWGQLHKSREGLATLLDRYGFTVIHSDVWSDETSSAVFLFELQSLELPTTFTHGGPEVYMKDESLGFLRKHVDSSRTVAGPWLEGNRWFVQLFREMTKPEALFEHKLSEARLGDEIEKMARRGKQIALREEVISLAATEKGYLLFVERFLKRRPVWLEWKSKPPQKTT